MHPVYPDHLEIQPLHVPPFKKVKVPGSKSITNRGLVLAALAGRNQPVVLQGVLQSDDTQVMADSLQHLGFKVQADWDTETISVQSTNPDRIIPAAQADLFVGNSGTTMRFLTALVSLGTGRYRIDGVARMRQRPIEDLLHALRQLGVQARSEGDNGFPPVIVEADGMRGGLVKIKGDISSQFLSGLLMAAPLAESEVAIEVHERLVSAPYVEMTLEMMWHFGVEVEYDDSLTYFEAPCAAYQPRSLEVEPDASAASYFFAAAAISGGMIVVPRLGRDSLQGDIRFVEVLEQMGCWVLSETDSIGIGGGRLRGIDVDMNAISDTVMTLAAVACFAEGPTTIRNVSHIRHKETDRLAALATELRRVGAEVEEFADGLQITPRPLHAAEIETYDDHRMAMSLALVGLKVPGIVIKNPGCVAKTYPRFFEDLEKLRTQEGSKDQE